MLDTEEFTYTVDMFRDTLHLLVETPENPFVAPVNIQTIEAFMNRIGYQGVVDKVSAFYTKNLAQPWQTMFKVFNHCLTTRTPGHDQIKINILQLFHDVINRTNVDYDALLWWDFINNVFQKKEAIQIDEDYHSIKDDIPLVSVYTIGNVLVRGMLILDEFLTKEICATNDFKEYETVFVGVDVPMNQPQPVVSTQEMHRSTPRAHRTPIVSTANPQGKKRKQNVGESSSPRKSQKITIRKRKQSSTLIPPPVAEAQENIAKVQEKLDEEEIEKMLEGDEDENLYASVFVDSMINDDVDDSGTKIEPRSHKEHLKIIEPRSHKEHLEIVNDEDDQIEKEKKHDDDEKIDEVVMEKDDDDDVEKVNKGVKEKRNTDVATSGMEFRKENMQTLILSPIRSPRKVSTSDKPVVEELTDTVSPITITTSKDSSTSKRKKQPISYKMKILPGSNAGMCRQRGKIRSHIKNKFITRDFFKGKTREVLDLCNKVVHELTFAKTNEMINKKMPCLVNLAVNKDREVDPINSQEMISKEFSTHAPNMIKELFRKHMQHTILNLYPTTSSSTAGKSTTNLQQQLYLKMKSTPQDQVADLEL
ncbi:hypothetical protein Tco_0299180 [Tanacetum coccineum]